MRWSDLDVLQHVNNVVYVDYAIEVWDELRAQGQVRAEDPNHVVVDYRLPVLMSDKPIRIESAVQANTVTHTMAVAGSTQPAAIVTAHFDAEIEAARFEPSLSTGQLMLRYSDIDHRFRINPARMFELFQESRVLFINGVMKRANIPSIVIARADLQVIEPIRWQTEPLETQTWVKHVGGSSFSIRAQMCKDGVVQAVAETVMVAFDPKTQKASSLNEAQRDELRALMLPQKPPSL